MLDYALKHADNESAVLDQVYGVGRPPPPWLADAPEVPTGLDPFYAAFWRLCSERLGGPDTHIPWTAVQRYAEVQRFDMYDVELLHTIVFELDMQLQRWRKDKREKNKIAAENAGKRKKLAAKPHVQTIRPNAK